MTDKQPEALLLAAELEDAGKPAPLAEAAAYELRRLHEKCEALTADTIEEMGRIVEIWRLLAQRDALLEALRYWLPDETMTPAGHEAKWSEAVAAIKKAEEGK